jgi:hypothetical protein
VTNNPAGQPQVALAGESARVAAKLGIGRVLVSISHTGDWAVASAIGMDEEGSLKTGDRRQKGRGRRSLAAKTRRIGERKVKSQNAKVRRQK